MITELTPEQEALLPGIRAEWVAHGLSTQRADRAAAEEGVRQAYISAGLEPPTTFYWAKSPLAGAIMAAHLTADLPVPGEDEIDLDNPGVPKVSVRNETYEAIPGQHEAGWLSFYDALDKIGVDGMDRMHGVMEVAKNAGWWWAFTEAAVITDRPIAVHLDQQNRLHCEDGAAIAYQDGFGVYSWNGTRVPKDLIENGWTTDQILQETNTEIRRCAIEKMGWETFVLQAEMKLVGEADDPGNPGYRLSLYDVPDIFDEPVRVLVCDNATEERDGTRRRFGLTVPRNIKTPVAAAAWTFDVSEKEYLELFRAC